MEQTQSIKDLILDIDSDKLVLPEFQRDFVWEISKTYDLFDSIVKDIFIGAIIYGIPSFEIAVREIDHRPKIAKGKKRPHLTIRNISLEDIQKRQKLDKSNFKLVLDGQQRITSLYRAIKGIDEVWFISKNSSEIGDKSFDKCDLEELLSGFDGNQDNQKLSIKISDVWNMESEDYDEEYIRENFFYTSDYYKFNSHHPDFDSKAEFRKFRLLKKKIGDLFKQEKLLSFYLLDMSLEKFVIFFERSNTRGVQLNFIDILAAKLYTGNFNLKQKINDFQKQYPNYELIPEIIVRTIAYITSQPKQIDRNYILTSLKASDFIELWDQVCDYYKISLDFLYENNYIISQDWMPYDNMLIPIIIFLKEIKGSFHKMSQSQKDFLTFWYLNSVFSLRYSGSSNERIIEDSNILTLIAQNKKINSNTFFNKLSKIQILSSEDVFSFDKKSNAIYKGILNLIGYNSKGLIDWNNDSVLSLNSELEDHHIYPKAFIEKFCSEADKEYTNCVANRTLVPKKLNIKISDQKPSVYLREIQSMNSNFEHTLNNHLITKELLTGEYDNEFSFFLNIRAEEIFKLIEKYVKNPFAKIKDSFYEEIKYDENSNINVIGTYKGNKISAAFNPITSKVFLNGKLYDSPSAAAQAAKIEFGASSDNTENGWTFWRFIDNNGEERKINDLRND